MGRVTSPPLPIKHLLDRGESQVYPPAFGTPLNKGDMGGSFFCKLLYSVINIYTGGFKTRPYMKNSLAFFLPGNIMAKK
jgi:hypothetical protein